MAYRKATISSSNIRAFRKVVYAFSRTHHRDFPWRRTTESYRILVSEVMLQQTQAERVIKKYRQFVKQFPSIRALARASLKEVLLVWQGLGYNRRALALKKIAHEVVARYGGKIPSNIAGLTSLSGIGTYTAGAVLVFAYNRPVIMIETNIRSVFLHHFFRTDRNVEDRMILPIIEATLDRRNPRRWYGALMDYGSYLKKVNKNPSRRSAHYTRQPKFIGSRRQIRGRIISTLISNRSLTVSELGKEVGKEIGCTQKTIYAIVQQLIDEGIVSMRRTKYTIASEVKERKSARSRR
ncbi:MAG: A/G-specific adenine glycosylase [Candidatus Kerfeldbacteria bacterium]